jgi:hypothetical protein
MIKVNLRLKIFLSRLDTYGSFGIDVERMRGVYSHFRQIAASKVD